MYIDITSLLVGVGATFFIVGFFAWSEKRSLANRVAYYYCEKANYLIALKREYLHNPKDGCFEYAEDDSIFPIVTGEFEINILPDKETDDISAIDKYSVYMEEHELWFIIENKYYSGGIEPLVQFYFCEAGFKEPSLILTPHRVDVRRHFLKQKNVLE